MRSRRDGRRTRRRRLSRTDQDRVLSPGPSGDRVLTDHVSIRQLATEVSGGEHPALSQLRELGTSSRITFDTRSESCSR